MRAFVEQTGQLARMELNTALGHSNAGGRSNNSACTRHSWTAPAERSGDGALAGGDGADRFHAAAAGESGVAQRFPPQSKTALARSQPATSSGVYAPVQPSILTHF